MFQEMTAHWGVGIADMVANRPIAAAVTGFLLVIIVLFILLRGTAKSLGQAIETEDLISER